MKLRTAITTATTAAVLATAGVALAGAASTTSPTSSTPSAAATAAAPGGSSEPNASTPSIHRKRHRRLRVRAFVRKVVIETIGIDRATLRRELRRGQTIAAIATANHVAPQAVVDALVTAATEKLDAAASSGRITTERAQAIEARLPARFTKLVNRWHPRRFRHAAPEVRQ
jgi:hypothetical protein